MICNMKTENPLLTASMNNIITHVKNVIDIQDVSKFPDFELLSFKFLYFTFVIDYTNVEVEVSFNHDVTYINYTDLRKESKIVENLELTIYNKLTSYTNLVN